MQSWSARRCVVAAPGTLLGVPGRRAPPLAEHHSQLARVWGPERRENRVVYSLNMPHQLP